MKFGDCELLPDGKLITPGADQELTPRRATVLSTLLASMPIAVSTEALLEEAWGEEAGTTQKLAKAIFGIRRALDGSKQVTVDSVYGYGYRIRVDESEAHPDPRAVADAICDEAWQRLSWRRGAALKVAADMFEQAARIQPGYARVPLGYAEARLQLTFHGYEPGIRAWPAIESAARDALELEPESAAARAYLGLSACVHHWDYAASDSLFDEALGRAPWDPAILGLAGRAKLFQGLHEEALDLFRRGMEVSPMTTILRAHHLFTLAALGDIEAAREAMLQLQEVDPEGAVGHRIWFEANYGNPALGLAYVSAMQDDSPPSSIIAALHAFALARSGEEQAARSLIRSMADSDRYPAPNAAQLCLPWISLGDRDTAVAALESAAAVRDFWLGATLWHADTEPLHSLPGFVALRNRLRGGVATNLTGVRGPSEPPAAAPSSSNASHG